MKLRLDEYYSIISYDWEDIQDYMSEDMAEELLKFEKSHNQDEVFDYLENLYSYIQVIDLEYTVLDIDLEKGYTEYKAIIKVNNKYYSFNYYQTPYWSFEDKIDANVDLIEVFPKEVTITKYE